MEGSFSNESELSLSFENIRTSPNFINLKKLVNEIESQKELNLQIPPTKAAKLKILKDKVVNEIQDTEIIPVIYKADQLLGKSNQTNKILKLETENTQLKQEISDLKEENARLSQAPSQSSFDNEELFSSPSQNKKSEQKLLKTITELRKRINDLQNEQIDKDSEIENLQHINENLQQDNEKMENYIKKCKDKIQKFEDLVYDTDQQNQKLKKQIEDLQMQNELAMKEATSFDGKEEMELENAQLKQQVTELAQFSDKQNDQYNELCQQIQDLYSQRMKLSELVYKLLQELEVYERFSAHTNKDDNTNKDFERSTATRDITPLISTLSDNEADKTLLQTLVSQIKELVASDQNAVDIIENTKYSDEDKLFQVVEYLLNQKQTKKTQQELEARNEALVKAVYSQLRFINELANSRELQKLMIQAPQNEMLRKILQSSCTSCKQYLAENNITLMQDEKSCFDYLLPRNSAQNSPETQQEYLINEVAKYKNIEDSNLFLLTVQCLITNDVLKKYSQELRNVAQKQGQENRVLKDQIKQLQDDAVAQQFDSPRPLKVTTRGLGSPSSNLNSTDGNFRTTVHRLLLRCRDILQEQVDGLELDPEDIQKEKKRSPKHTLSSLHEEEEKTEIEEEEDQNQNSIIDLSSLDELIQIVAGGQNLPDNQQYILKLEKKVESQKSKFQQSIDHYDQMIQELKNEITKSQEDFNKINEQNQVRISADAQTILDNEARIEQLEKENEDLRNDLSAARNEVARMSENSKLEVEQISNHYRNVKTDFNDLIEHLHEKLVEFSQESRDQFTQSKHLIKKYLNTMKFANQEMKKTIIEIISDKNSQIKKLERALQQIQSKIQQAEEDSEKYKEELKQEKQKNIQSNIRIKTMEMKQKAQEEAMQRDLSLKQKQMEFQQRAKEAESEQKIERTRMEAQRQTHELYTKICRNFKEFVDISQPISIETVEKIMVRVNDRLNVAKEDKRIKDDLLDQIEALKKIMNIKENQQNVRLTSVLSDYMHTTNLQLNKVDRLQQENDRMRGEIAEARKTNSISQYVKEWENWAKKVSQIAFDTQDYCKDSKILRKKLEEVIMHATDPTAQQRKLEIMRAQKHILEKGYDQIHATKHIRMKAPILVCVSVALMQRLSGCVHTDLGGIGIDFDNENDREDMNSTNDSFVEKPPLFGQFVIPSK